MAMLDMNSQFYGSLGLVQFATGFSISFLFDKPIMPYQHQSEAIHSQRDP